VQPKQQQQQQQLYPTESRQLATNETKNFHIKKNRQRIITSIAKTRAAILTTTTTATTTLQ
jgi:hypothetical protein